MAAVAASPGAAQHRPDLSALHASAEPVGGALELFLEVTLNGVRTGKVAAFVLREGAWWVTPATLRELGLRVPREALGDDQVALGQLAGLRVSYDAASQRIALMAPVALLERADQKVATAQDSPEPDAPLPSLVLSYDLYGQQIRGSVSGRSLSAWNEVRLAGVGPGAFESTSVTRSLSMPGTQLRENVRLDTRWQYDVPASMASLTVGDAVSGALSWSRATRIGGVRLARNFGLQPYLATAPAALVRGEAVLPSTVDLYVNGVRQVTRSVQPGAFVVEGTPMLNGAGLARLVITDLNGQQRAVELPLYGTPQLLRPGLFDGSVEVGAVREDYGLRSADYGRLMASATGRYGWNEALTIEGHAEGDRRVAMGGAGATWRLPAGAGALSFSGAASRAGTRAGRQGGLGYQWSREPLSVSMTTLRRDRGFADVASYYDAEMPLRTDQAFAGVTTRWGSFGSGYVRQQYASMPSARIANLTWTTDLRRSATLSTNILRDLQGGHTTLSVTFNMPLDGAVSLGAGARGGEGNAQATVSARRTVPGDLPGWGWRAEAAAGDQRSALGELTRQGRHGRWTAGVLQQDGDLGPASTTFYAGASGALLWAAGEGFAVPRIDEAFALVSTDGVAGVPVQVENRPMGETGPDGMLLVRGLRPYERNRLTINPLKLDPDMRLEADQSEVVPPGRTGVAARFRIRRVLALQAMLRDPGGEPMAAGLRAWLEAPGAARKPLVVGYDGLVYVEDPPSNARFVVEAEPACAAPLPALEGKTGLLDAGVLTCRSLSAGAPSGAPPP